MNDNYNNPINFEISPVPYENLYRQPPFTPGGGNFPGGNLPGGNFPGGNFPGGNLPGSSFPGGFDQSPPPNYIPSKNDAGVQSFGSEKSSKGGVGAKAVSPSSIRFCLFKYTYIWERNGRSYWAFLINVDRDSVSGFRWLGRYWVYFGVSLKRIDSFFCSPRFDSNESDEYRSLKQDDISLLSSKVEYSPNGTKKDVYSQTLASLDIPEVSEDSLVKTIGCIDDNEITTEVPCIKARNIAYRITLEVSYPNNYRAAIKNKINTFANEAANEAYKIISYNRGGSYLNPLESYNASVEAIPEALMAFERCFMSNLNALDNTLSTDCNISYTIRQEKIHNNWRVCNYNY